MTVVAGEKGLIAAVGLTVGARFALEKDEGVTGALGIGNTSGAAF